MSRKIVDIGALLKEVAQWRVKNNRIVFTNGCFDIVHVGHLHTLGEASKLGDKLIVGLNSDASVKRLKGNHRPIVPEQNRADLLAALHMVDSVILFDEDTPLQLIKRIQPDVLVKGGDWKLEEIVGGDLVQKAGGKVVSVPFKSKDSTSEIIKKIQSL